MKIDAQLTFDNIAHNQDTDAHLVVTLTAPMKDGEAARPPICIIPVIDVSGSMTGAKLDYAKQSAIKLVEHLKVGDYCGVVAFDSQVRVIAPAQKLTAQGKENLKVEIGKLRTGGSTNFAGGLLAALDELAKLDLPVAVLQRVVMFTDGHANAGVAQRPSDIIRLLANAGRATVSAFGYGEDTDQQFLLDFAKEGKGNFAFIQDPDGALSAFGKELGGLLSTYATNLDVLLDPLAGHEIVQVVSDVDADEEKLGGNVSVKIPDIFGEETRHLVFAVKLKAQKAPGPRAVNVFDVKLGYDVIDALGKRERKTLEAKAKVRFVKPGEEDRTSKASLAPTVALARLVRAQIEAEAAAKSGNFLEARTKMVDIGTQIRKEGLEQIAFVADNMSLRLADSTSYQANQGYLRSMQQGVTRGVGGSSYAVEAEASLEVLGVAIRNQAQDATARSFVEGSSADLQGLPTSLVLPTSLGITLAPQNLQPGPSVTAQTPKLGKPAERKPIRQNKKTNW